MADILGRGDSQWCECMVFREQLSVLRTSNLGALRGFFCIGITHEMQKEGENHPHFPSVKGREKTREIHATCMQLEEEENPSEPCALPGDAFTVSLQRDRKSVV